MKSNITAEGILKSVRSDMREFLNCVDRNGRYKNHSDDYGCSSDACYAVGDFAKHIIKDINNHLRRKRGAR